MSLNKTFRPGENEGIYISTPVLNRYPHRHLPPLIPLFQMASPRRSQAPGESIIHASIMQVPGAHPSRIHHPCAPRSLLLLVAQHKHQPRGAAV